VTTIGTAEQKYHDSAIFFSSSFHRDRIMNLFKKKDNSLYVKIIHRKKWIKRIERHQIKISFSQHEQKRIQSWENTKRFTKDDLMSFISTQHWRTYNGINF